MSKGYTFRLSPTQAPARYRVTGRYLSARTCITIPSPCRLRPREAGEVRRYGIIGGEHDDVLKLVKKLRAVHPGASSRFCQEAGPRGLALCRCLRSHGLDCIINVQIWVIQSYSWAGSEPCGTLAARLGLCLEESCFICIAWLGILSLPARLFYWRGKR